MPVLCLFYACFMPVLCLFYAFFFAFFPRQVTEISPLALFHPAEAYHSDYFAKNPEQGYCQAVVRKKVEKAKEYVGKL
jgi:hypothetical protein